MRRGRNRSRHKGRKSPLRVIAMLLLLLIAVGFVYRSPLFERVPPKITTANEIDANSKTPITFKVSDNTALKSVKVLLKSSNSQFTLYEEQFTHKPSYKEISIVLPQSVIASNIAKWDIEIIATDASLWNFLLGNKAVFHGTLTIDNQPPRVSVLAKSPGILQGGSALVIYRVDEKHLKKSYIDIGNGVTFKPIRYKKEGVYAALIAWPFNKEQFAPKIIAIDTANNKTVLPLTIRHHYKKYRVSKIRATDHFINGKISQLATSSSNYSSEMSKIEKFKVVNELMRKKNEALIHKYTKNVTPVAGKWDIKAFHPLHRAKRVAGFGEQRYYYYKSSDNIISSSKHLGFDLASVRHDNIHAASNGRVVFVGNNGIYGNMPIIDHGLGLYTIYGHCSQILVKKGDRVKAGQVIAKTGQSGLALGDHLHFGVLVQGIEVYPLEWMKKNWINSYIFATFQKADTILGYN